MIDLFYALDIQNHRQIRKPQNRQIARRALPEREVSWLTTQLNHSATSSAVKRRRKSDLYRVDEWAGESNRI